VARWTDDIAPASELRVSKPDLASSVVEAVARRDRLVVFSALIVITLLAWGYLLSGAGMPMDMQGMDINMVMPMNWTTSYALVMLLMWWTMMVAMMLPSAAPMILLFALVNRRSRDRGVPYVPTAYFASGYLIAWGAFSLIATLLQWYLDQSGWLTMAMASANRWLGAGLLIAAGIYQLTPLKHACLRHCRGPLDFITRHWRPGNLGALRMGLAHGTVCVGCCWMIMGLLFYGGVMNLYWIIGLAALVLLEKILPAGHRLGNMSGMGFLVWGIWLLA
jgi:predicted metal-binding membrane protein